MRRGEQRQLKWSDIEWLEKNVVGGAGDDTYSFVKITVRAETTKVRKTRRFVVKDWEYFDELFKLTYPIYKLANKDRKDAKPFGQTYVFSVDGSTMLSARVLEYHFASMLKNVKHCKHPKPRPGALQLPALFYHGHD